MNRLLGTKPGIGLNLRLETIDHFLNYGEGPGTISGLQVIADNWLSQGPQHEKLGQIRKIWPISFHCVGMNLGGTDPLNLDYLKSIKDLSQRFEPTNISDHLCMQAHQGIHFHDLLPIPFSTASLANVCDRIQRVQDFLGRQLLIENISYYFDWKKSEFSEIDFISEVLQSTGCGLLLDVQNLWVNEQNLTHSMTDFLNKIDWKKVQEVHLAGGEVQDSVLVDTHGSFPSAEVLKALEPWKNRLRQLPLFYERDKNPPVFESFLVEHQQLNEWLWL